MKRKELKGFSYDELRILKWKYLETTTDSKAERESISNTLKRINKELYIKRFKHESNPHI